MPALNFHPYVQSSIDLAIVQPIVSAHFPFYQGLNNTNKERFLERLMNFIPRKQFVPRQELELTDEMRVLISACAVQLTFGLDIYTMDYFETILVYPDIYKSPHSDYMHHGEVNLAGFICFSWKSLKKGIGRDDNFNVGLHEWAHALRFNGFKGNEGDPFFESYFIKWLAAGNSLYNSIRGGQDKLFNKYAGSNLGEFFPVMMEHFFENPEDFKQNYKEEYEYTCILLNIDPLNKMNPVNDVRRNILSRYSFKDDGKTLLQGSNTQGFYAYFPFIFILSVFAAAAVIINALVCSLILVVLLLVPIVRMIIKKKRSHLTEAGLIIAPQATDWLNRKPRSFSWEQIVSVEFDEIEEGEPLHGYRVMSFNVFNTDEKFERHNLYANIDYNEGVKLENYFRSRNVAVVRKRKLKPKR